MSRTGTPLLWLAIDPKTHADAQRLAQGLQELMAEDSALHVETEQGAGPVIIGAVGEPQLEIIVDRLKREFNVEAFVGRLQVAYKEAFTRPADGEMRYVKQAGDRGQYGHVKIHLFPGEPGTGYVFENKIVGDAIPKQYIRSIDEGIRQALRAGVLAGHPIDDVRVELYDGSYHNVDSSETAFRIAGSMAFHDAARKAGPVVLEPMMRVEVVAPKEFMSDVMGNLASRRGHTQSLMDRGGAQVLSCLVPLAKLFGYATDLRLRTRGRGSYTMQLEEYRPVETDSRNDDRDSNVTAPCRPSPTLRDSRIAIPEPDEDSPN
jgi:elongation factor G